MQHKYRRWYACRYFPFKEDRETVPQAVNQFIRQAQKDGGMGTQLTQAITQLTQNPDFQDEVIEINSADEAEEIPGTQPIFEVFWQVTLSCFVQSGKGRRDLELFIAFFQRV